jgi:uncharacterized protein (DUF362 family)/Pyruvate/2-oxoacid:ferredoxin oxidoreductase delta subunit
MAQSTEEPQSTVAVIRCDSYDNQIVLSALRAGFDLLGGAARFFRAGERIILKPNVLFGNHPDRCVTTHPAIFSAMAIMLRECNVRVSYGDSPAGILPVHNNMEKSHLAQVAAGLDIPLADFSAGRWVSYPAGLSSKKLYLANALFDCDGMVGLPKCKTHGLTRFTGAVKNFYGCVPGMVKGEYHARFPDVVDFSRLLVDICAFVNPRLHVMDAVMAMEGNGPQSGTPKKLGLILISADPVALDSVASRIIGLNPAYVPTSVEGEKSGLGNMRSERINVVGESIDAVADTSFKVVRLPPVHLPQGRLTRILRNIATPRPAIRPAKCIRCGKCVEACPVAPKAVDWARGDKQRPPVYDYNRCIRCFCCQELCPVGAIGIVTPLLIRVLPPLSYIALLFSSIWRKHRKV